MKKIYVFLGIVVLIFSACEKLPTPDANLASGNPHYQVAFLDTKSIQDIRVKDDEGSLQETEIKVKIANPVDKDTYYRIGVDKSFLSNFNVQNGVDYQNLPLDNFELSYTGVDKITKTGTYFDILIPKGKIISTGKLVLKIKPMKDQNGQNLPISNVYALALQMNPNDINTLVQEDKKTSLFVIRRSFKTKVAHLKGGAFHAIYAKDTGDQTDDKKDLVDDPEIDEWTLQYSFALTNLTDNWGLMYDNPRHNTRSILWNTVQGDGKFLMRYGAAATLVFNTGKGKNFKFAAAGSDPTADKWYHVTMTYKTIDGRPFLKIYVNGELMFDSPSPVIARKFPLVCFGNGRTMGYLREFRFWSKALTQGQAIATQYFVKPDSEGLELYIPFNEIPYEEIQEGGVSVKVLKNLATNSNKKYPEKWYLNVQTRGPRYPSVDFDTEVEF